MGTLSWGLLAFASGLTLSGLSGSILELATGCRLSLSPPFVRPERLAQTLWRTALAGPFMLANEALACRRSGRMGDLPTAAAMLACGIWALAQGVILVSLASAASARL
ncbi:MAG: hypothetical protein ABWZ57_18575 [Mesorhizobium sp.]|jgi:hypothetical protein